MSKTIWCAPYGHNDTRRVPGVQRIATLTVSKGKMASSLILHFPERKRAKGNCVAIAATVIPMITNPGV